MFHLPSEDKMVRSGQIKHCFCLLITVAFLSIGLLFVFVERSPQAVVKIQNRFRASREILVKSSITTRVPTNGDHTSYSDRIKRVLQTRSKRQVLLIVAHGRSGSTFLADIFNRHPRVFYVFEPLHGLIAKQGKGYDQYALNFLYHIFQCDFSVGNSTRNFGRFFRFHSRAMSSPPFCKYEPTDERWHSHFCSSVNQEDLEHSCKTQHDTIVYKFLLERLPGHSIEKLFGVCELARIECKVIHLIRDIRPVVMSSKKVAFFKEVDRKEKPALQQYVYSHCEMTESNLQLVKMLDPSLRSRYVVVRYEDLAVQPLQLLEYVYEFAGLEVLEKIKQWLVNTTQPSDNDLKEQARNPVSVVRNSLEVLNKWRLVAESCDISIIERYCRDVMRLMGYMQTQGSTALLRNLSIPLFTATYPAQQWMKGYKRLL